jgi:ATP-dependent helicase/nuclease subunit B
MPRRIFLPWPQPLLPAVAAHLTRDWTGGALDLSDTVAVVPTAEAARQLRERLAIRAEERGTAVLAPHLITPEGLTSWALQEMPEQATPAAALLLWMETLQAIPLEEYSSLFPVPPVSRDTTWARATASEFLRLRHRLEEGGRTFAMAAARLGPEHPEAARWADLAKLEQRVLTALERCALADPQASRLAAARRPVFPPGTRRIVLLAVPDPVALALMLLEHAERDGLAVDVLIHADEALADTFDTWGRPLQEYWTTCQIPIPLPDRNIRLLPRPSDEAAALLAELNSGRSAASADPAVAPPLLDLAARAGTPLFDPNGTPLATHSLTWLLQCLAALLNSGECVHAARLLRLPDVLRTCPVDVSAATALRQWDEFQQEHLPRTLDDALTLFPSWKPRGATPESPAPVLVAVLRWMAGLSRDLQGAHGHAALHDFIAAVSQDKPFASPDDAALYDNALDAWLDTLESLAESSRRTGIALPVPALLDTALHLLRDARLYPDNSGGDATLHGWLELPWLTAPELTIAGLNEGIVPDSITGDAWLPDSVRGALDLKTNATRLSRDSYLLTSLLACHRESGRVILLAARETESGDPLKPSRLLLRCPLEDLPGRTLQLFPKEESDNARPTPPAWHRAWTWRVPPPPQDAKIFSKLSVTQFSDYLACPFRFYLKHVLGMEPFDATRDEMEPRHFGSLIHDTIERVHHHETLRDSADAAALADFMDETVRQLAAERFGPAPALPVLFQLESARSRLRSLATIQAAERTAGWRMEHVEVAFPAELEGIEINGRIDLIEYHEEHDIRRVLDYKTGSKGTKPREAHLKALRGKAPDDIPPWQICTAAGKPHRWTNLQLPFYLWITARRGHAATTTGYINLPAATSESALNLWDDLDDELLESAMDCARGVIRSIRAGIFWPPRRPDYDDFKSLVFHDITGSFDPSLLLKFQDLRQAEA